jgi:hypothetical protein
LSPIKLREIDMEEFFGSDLCDLDCEALMIEKFGVGERAFKAHFKLELSLFQTKWFDYRLMHPVTATYLYAHEFVKSYRRYYAMTIDCGKARYVKGYSGKDPWLIKNAMMFVKGRRQADKLGTPYDFYINAAYEFLYVKKWKHLPRPCHLYAEDVIEFVDNKWREYSRSALMLAESDFFRDEGNAERPEFIAHQRWMMDRLQKSKIKEIAAESLRERGFIVLPIR